MATEPQEESLLGMQNHLAFLTAALLLALPANAGEHPFTSDRFQSELAAVSWNALQGLVRLGRRAPRKTDLTRYIGLVPELGSVTFFETSIGDVFRSEVLDVQPAKKGQRIIGETTINGVLRGRGIGVISPGKKSWLESENVAGIQIDLKRPMTTRWHRVRPDKAYKIRGGGRAIIDGLRVKARYKGTWTFVGFEAIETPGGNYPNTAAFDSSLTLTFKKRGVRVRLVIESTQWYALDVGHVASTERALVRSGGETLEDSGQITSWRIDDPAL